MTEGPDVPFVDDCGHNEWEEVDCKVSPYQEVYWEKCKRCGLRRTVYISEYSETDRIVYWWPKHRTEEEYR